MELEGQRAPQRQTLFCKVDQQTTQGFVERREYLFEERVKRTGKIVAILFGSSVLALFVPILHFVLVPVLLICTIAFGISTWVDKAEILRGEFSCPQCQKLNTLPRESEGFPKTSRCQHCYFTLHLDLKP